MQNNIEKNTYNPANYFNSKMPYIAVGGLIYYDLSRHYKQKKQTVKLLNYYHGLMKAESGTEHGPLLCLNSEHNSFVRALLFGALISASVAIQTNSLDKEQKLAMLQRILENITLMRQYHLQHFYSADRPLTNFLLQENKITHSLNQIYSGTILTSQLIIQANRDCLRTDHLLPSHFNCALGDLANFILYSQAMNLVSLGYPAQEILERLRGFGDRLTELLVPRVKHTMEECNYLCSYLDINVVMFKLDENGTFVKQILGNNAKPLDFIIVKIGNQLAFHMGAAWDKQWLYERSHSMSLYDIEESEIKIDQLFNRKLTKPSRVSWASGLIVYRAIVSEKESAIAELLAELMETEKRNQFSELFLAIKNGTLALLEETPDHENKKNTLVRLINYFWEVVPPIAEADTHYSMPVYRYFVTIYERLKNPLPTASQRQFQVLEQCYGQPTASSHQREKMNFLRTLHATITENPHINYRECIQLTVNQAQYPQIGAQMSSTPFSFFSRHRMRNFLAALQRADEVIPNLERPL